MSDVQEKTVTQLARAMASWATDRGCVIPSPEWIERARLTMRECKLIAIDHKLVEAVRDADEGAARAPFTPLGMTRPEIGRAAAQRAIATGHADADEHVTEEEQRCARARLALADDVLTALEPKP